MNYMLKEGDKAPLFELVDQKEKSIALEDYLGKKVFLYFYPKANTPGCTTQACEIRNSMEYLTSMNIQVLGISLDTSKKQANFDRKYSLNFPLLCDVDHIVSEKYGVWGQKKLYGKVYNGLIRSSFLIDESGIILNSWYKISPKKTVPEVIEYLNKI